MKHRAVVLKQARHDVREIWQHSAKIWGTAQADKYIAKIRAGTAALALNPMAGGACDQICAGYRRYPAGSHMLFERVTKTTVKIIRILHERMDFGQHL